MTSGLHPGGVRRIFKRGRVLSRNGILEQVISSGRVPGLVFCNPSNMKGAAITGVVTRGYNGGLYCLGTAATSATSVGSVVSAVNAVSTAGNVLLCLSRVRCFGGGRRRVLLSCVRGNSVALVTSAARGPFFCICGTVLDHSAIFRFGPLSHRSVVKIVGHTVDVMDRRGSGPVGVDNRTVHGVTDSTGKSMQGSLGALRLYLIATRGHSTVSIDSSLLRRVLTSGSIECSHRNSRRCSIVSTCRGSVHNSSPSTTICCLNELLTTNSLPDTYEQLLIYTGRSIKLTCPRVVPVMGTTISATLCIKLPRTEVPLTGTIVLITATPGSGTTCRTVGATVTSVRQKLKLRVPHRLRGGRFSKRSTRVIKRGCGCPRDCGKRCMGRRCLPGSVGGGGCCGFNSGGFRRTSGRC